MFEKTIHLEGVDLLEFYGVNNTKLDLIKSLFPKLKIIARGEMIKVKGSEEDNLAFEQKINELLDYYHDFHLLTKR
jgi:phosphate starvation-inducible protein PhoH and related proteins